MRRPHGPPLVIGLTGGIGMGKSTAAALFRRARVPVFDADRMVHALQAPGGAAVGAIATLVPDALVRDRTGGENDAIDRARLRAALAIDPALLPALEAILHPLVRRARDRFLARCRRMRAPVAVLDVPLLLEGGGERYCDFVLVVSAPPSVQRARLRRRRRLSEADAARLIARQMPDHRKRRLADVVIPTGLARAHAMRRVHRLLGSLRARSVQTVGRCSLS